ncbi:uncharacterized protein LOC143869783 [Tasmannia lanceolata]|uniref:uncharacterized protein LOC143869783 n=1 Tax=Tasmannia lanceolata TaxID=3420 RepID=UPI004063EBD4
MAIFPQHLEGQSTTRPPYFNGSNYGYWKANMKIFLTQDFQIWRAIQNGYTLPTKNLDEWAEQEQQASNYNAKAMNALICALSPEEFNRVANLTSAKEIPDILEVTHEGRSQVRESKMNHLFRQHELFQMEPNETITDMYTRFTNITNGLKVLEKQFSNKELVSKILRSLPKSWESRTAAIIEAKDLNRLSSEELIGSLTTHEMMFKTKEPQLEDKMEKGKGVALVCDAGKDEVEGENLENEIALMTMNFSKFLRRNMGNMNNRRAAPQGKKEEEFEDQPRYFKCKKVGHIRPECPLNNTTTSNERLM